MADLPPNFWARTIATITVCAVSGAPVGLVVGLLVDNVGRSIALGVLGGAIVSVIAIYLLGERRRGH